MLALVPLLVLLLTTRIAGSPPPRGVMDGKFLGDVSKLRELNIHYVLT